MSKIGHLRNSWELRLQHSAAFLGRFLHFQGSMYQRRLHMDRYERFIRGFYELNTKFIKGQRDRLRPAEVSSEVINHVRDFYEYGDELRHASGFAIVSICSHLGHLPFEISIRRRLQASVVLFSYISFIC